MSIFRNLKRKRLKTSKFHMPNQNLLSCNFGELIPFFCEDVIPGDTWRIRSEILAKFAPMRAPIMANMDIYTWYFFVPNRLIWKDWEDFITGGRTGRETPPEFPSLTIYQADFDSAYGSLLKEKSLADYFGVNKMNYSSVVAPDKYIRVSQLPFRAYQLIYNEYFRDQNLEPELNIPLTSGALRVGSAISLLTKRNKKFAKDYFTSALPWAQRGGAVDVPLSGQLDVMLADDEGRQQLRDVDGNLVSNTALASTNTGETSANLDPNGTLKVDLAQENTGMNLETLRYSNALQRWLENNARFGSRYIEQVLARFGVLSSDARLQRPELIGGGKQNIMISEVLQTSQTTDDSVQGNRSGDANSYGQHKLFGNRFFEEHGQIIGIMSIVPKSYYYQGIKKSLTKFDKFDYFNPEFQTLGEQPIKWSELYVTGIPDEDNATFGYAPRYSEYKFRENEIHGDFKESLAFWHTGRFFGNRPALNDSFISIKHEDYARIFALQDVDFSYCWIQIYNDVVAKRPMMYNPNPSL